MGDREEIEQKKEYEKYKDVIKLYREFKRLREVLGKPVETKINPKRIKKDLGSKEFLVLIEEIKGKKH